MAAVTASFRRFLVPEAYPILFFTTSAATMFTGFIGRLLVSDPDIMSVAISLSFAPLTRYASCCRCTKARRSGDYLDPEVEAKTAEKHYNHFIRRVSIHSTCLKALNPLNK